MKKSNGSNGNSIAETIKDSLMVIITLTFVLLYAAAFTGKFDPLKDNNLLLRLEPIIFILIGFYIGRFPARRTEKILKEEINRQTQRADAAQYAREKIKLEREMLEEKIKNVKASLLSTEEKHSSVQGIINILES